MKAVLLMWKSDKLSYYRIPIDRLGDFAATFTAPVAVQELTGVENATWDKLLEVLNLKHIGPSDVSFNLEEYCIEESVVYKYAYDAVLTSGFRI